MRQSRNIRCDLHTSGIEKVSLSNMPLYPKYGVYKILLEISGLKKCVVINDLSLKPMSLNPKFTIYIYIWDTDRLATKLLTHYRVMT